MKRRLLDLLRLFVRPECRHENYGVTWKAGVKSVVCVNCHKLLWCREVPRT